MNSQENQAFIQNLWEKNIIPTLMDYIRIPNKSPHFDPAWQENGHMMQAVNLIADWCKQQGPPDLSVEVIQLNKRTPIIFMELPGSSEETVLLYGHLDKQPEMSGWDPELHPWKPVRQGDKLYGRGSADDGYAAFASLAAILSLRAQKLPHARCVILIEACEESGSYDLPYYLEALQDRVGEPNLIICLDSGCGNYEQLWVTTSLRGLSSGILQIEVLTQGIHSGMGSGIVPSCFQILRQLLNRIEKDSTGEILLHDLHASIPDQRMKQTKEAAAILGDEIYKMLPFTSGVKPLSLQPLELILNHSWKPALSLIGSDGFPEIKNAGNVTLPKLAFKLSLRLPPTTDAEKAAKILKTTLEANPPYHAKIRYEITDSGSGWNAPQESAWLKNAADQASKTYFGKGVVYWGEGGSIPFMGMLGKRFPEAQFLITGLLGPSSNAHGPNEFLHIPTGKKLTCCIAEVLREHYLREK
ncbi:MAG TPA: M20 family metallopeptidase [Gammaproteobacteria bacterium]|nr:M20 family metallopeptidase [Gammaproteobacteria bacterium]